jgi:hypothetical protein
MIPSLLQESGKDYVLQTYLDQLPDGPPSHSDGGLSVSPKSTRTAAKDEPLTTAKGSSWPSNGRPPPDQVQVQTYKQTYLTPRMAVHSK